MIEVWVYKDLDFKKDLPRIARNSMSLAGAVILILASLLVTWAFRERRS